MTTDTPTGTPCRLGFLVTGAALAGGGTLEDYLNTRMGIYCAGELVGGRQSASALSFPGSFHTARVTGSDRRKALLDRRQGVPMLGLQDVKMLRTFDQIVTQVDGRRVLFCARPPAETAAAWAERQANGVAGWPAGRIGAFGAAEAVIAAAVVLAHAPDTTLVVPHGLLTEEPETALTGVLDFLGQSDSPVDAEASAALKTERAAKRDSRRREAKARRLQGLPAEEEGMPEPDKLTRRVLERVRADTIGLLLDGRDTVLLRAIAADLHREIAALPLNVVSWIVKIASEQGTPETAAYAAEWGKRMQPTWRRARAILVPEEAKVAAG